MVGTAAGGVTCSVAEGIDGQNEKELPEAERGGPDPPMNLWEFLKVFQKVREIMAEVGVETACSGRHAGL